MRRTLATSLLSVSLAACGDDSTQSVTIDTGADSFDDDDDDDDDATFDPDDGPDDEGPDDGPFDESATFDTSITDPSDVESGPFEESDTFESGPFEESGTFETSEGGTTTTGDGTTTTVGPTTDPSDSDPSDSGPTTSVGPTTDTDGTTTTDPTDTDATDTDPTGGGFDPPPPFGDDVQELDLVGMWNLNWDPESGFDSVIDIDGSGNFIWSESSADCSTTTLATGFAWVEGTQIVMHVEEWDRPLPWDTEPVLGETFPPPFRLLMSFSLQGTGGDAYLTFGAPSRITETEPYTGESYVRTVTEGIYLGGDWQGEAELQAIPAGATDPVVIVRDYYLADMMAETDMLDPQGTGTRSITTQYFPVPTQSSVFDGGNWTCLGGCPQPSGTTLVDGSNLYTYGPYAGQTHLLTFEDGRTFRRDVDSDCP